MQVEVTREDIVVDADQLGPANYEVPATTEQMRDEVKQVETNVYLDESFQTVRQQLSDDGFGKLLDSE
jgi:hypothetical protein